MGRSRIQVVGSLTVILGRHVGMKEAVGRRPCVQVPTGTRQVHRRTG